MPKEPLKKSRNEKTHIAALKVAKLIELMLKFNINPRDKNAWMKLSVKLSDTLFPGMGISLQMGAPTKWDFNNNLRLYALIETIKVDFPHVSIKEIYYKAVEVSQATLLKNVIKPDASPSTLAKLGSQILQRHLLAFPEQREPPSDLDVKILFLFGVHVRPPFLWCCPTFY